MPEGPLVGVRVVEFASIGPGPFCAMLLSDMGADIIRIDRPSGVAGTGPNAALQRGRPSLVLDLKNESDRALAFRAAAAADVLIEGNRPGVMERLGLGPEALMAANERLIYGRMTGYGQTGPDAHLAGHDINYLAQTGALDVIGDGKGPAASAAQSSRRFRRRRSLSRVRHRRSALRARAFRARTNHRCGDYRWFCVFDGDGAWRIRNWILVAQA